jgi:hypothetical protein
MAQAKSQPQAKLSGNNLLIIMILVTVLVIGVTVFAVKFLWADITLDTKVISAKNAANKTLGEDVSNAPKLIDAYHDLGDKKLILDDALPVTPDYEALITTLENLTQQAGVTVQSIAAVAVPIGSAEVAAQSSDPQAATTGAASGTSSIEPPVAQPYKFSVNLNASYAGVQKLLQLIELSTRPMRVTAANFSGSGTEMRVQLQMETYFQAKATLPFGTKEIK